MASLLASQFSCAVAESPEPDPMVGMLLSYLPAIQERVGELVGAQPAEVIDGFLLNAAATLLAARSASAVAAAVAVGVPEG